ncbi:MAG: serine hydrolase, partial [bacterium]|nr:serine hydrolase [bacterium]
MKRLAFFLLITATLAAQVLPRVEPAEVGLSSARLARVDDLIERHISQKQIAGAVTLVARQGKIAQFRAYGNADVEAAEVMKTDTIFRIASMTKPITSVAVMMLYEEGRFLLTD